MNKINVDDKVKIVLPDGMKIPFGYENFMDKVGVAEYYDDFLELFEVRFEMGTHTCIPRCKEKYLKLVK